MRRITQKLNVAASTALFTTALLSSAPTFASMQDQMETMFGSMSNSTSGSTFKTQTRGGATFGSVSIRTPIIDQSIVSWVPPSAAGGCGGIDMSGGSFSFIDKQQMVNTLKKVAANAEGYAFQLALDAVWPQAAGWIEVFQKKMQAMNQYLGNSCQLAQGVVNNTTAAFDLAMDAKNRTEASFTGASKDFAETMSSNWTPEESKNSPETSDLYKMNKGNHTYRALMEGGAVLTFPDGDKDMAEHIMSLTGFSLVPLDTEDGAYEANAYSAGKTGDKVNITQHVAPTMTLTQFMYGATGAGPTRPNATLNVMRCGTDPDDEEFCDEPSIETSDFEGFSKLIVEALLGSDTSPGLVRKMITNQGTPTPVEKSVLESMPASQGGNIRNLALAAPNAVHEYTRKAADSVALDLAFNLIMAAMVQTIEAVKTIKGMEVTNTLESLRGRRDQLRDEYDNLRAHHVGDSDKLAEEYHRIMEETTSEEYIKRNGQ